MNTLFNPGDPTERHLTFWERVGYPPVFINYRSGVDPDHDGAELLYAEMVMRYGPNSTFMASRSVRPATKFHTIINAALERAKLIIPVIGSNWAESLPTTSRQEGHPWVIHELQVALNMGAMVLPVMVTNDRRIRGDIPPEIARIADYQTMAMPLEEPPPGDDFVVRANKIALMAGFLLPQLLNYESPLA